jgi:hypothetical protein
LFKDFGAMDKPPTNGRKVVKRPSGPSLEEQRADQLRVLLMDSLKAVVTTFVLGTILFLLTYLYLLIKNNTVPSLESLAALLNGLATLVNAVLVNGQSSTP